MLRLRLIRGKQANGQNGNDAKLSTPVVTSYVFHLVADLTKPTRLAHQVAPLRTQTEHLRFREGQYGGYTIPQQVQPFELAPPQLTGVQPIYLS